MSKDQLMDPREPIGDPPREPAPIGDPPPDETVVLLRGDFRVRTATLDYYGADLIRALNGGT